MDLHALSSAPGTTSPDAKPRTSEEAAKQFEAVFVRQFVQVMTKDLFDSSTAEGSALAGGQADMQRDILTDTLTEHLVESGALRLSDLLLRQWARTDGAPTDSDASAAAPDPVSAPAPSSFWESFGNGYTPPPGMDDLDTE